MKWVIRTSTLRVSDGRGDRVYQAIDDAPEEGREQARRTFEGPNAQTILIANQEAYDHIATQREDSEAAGGFEALRRRFTDRAKRRLPADDVNWRRMLAYGLAGIVMLWALWLWAIRSGMS